MSVSGRPGAYVKMRDGTQHEIMESYASVVEQVLKANPYNMHVELTDWNTRKKIILRRDAIDSIREGGY